MSSLREKLKALEELQQIDLEINDVKAELAGIEPRRDAIEAKVADARRAYDEEKGRLDDNERERRQLESLLGMERDKVKKWEGRLGEIRTPREYAALSREIDIAKKSNEAQGEHVKTLAAAAGDITKALEARSEALAEQEEATQAERNALEARRGEIEQKLKDLDTRRGAAAKVVDPSLLSRYEHIKSKRAGIAVAAVVGMTCNGCHRHIPPQLAITLQRANSIEACPNCHRIIYAAEAVNPPTPSPA